MENENGEGFLRKGKIWGIRNIYGHRKCNECQATAKNPDNINVHELKMRPHNMDVFFSSQIQLYMENTKNLGFTKIERKTRE